jgi:hypothetical protein
MFHDLVCSPDESRIVPGAAERTTIQKLSSVYEGKKYGYQGAHLSFRSKLETPPIPNYPDEGRDHDSRMPL